jgi:molybdopterin-guanine dinucleotide biosynthesis protein A
MSGWIWIATSVAAALSLIAVVFAFRPAERKSNVRRCRLCDAPFVPDELALTLSELRRQDGAAAAADAAIEICPACLSANE